MSRIDSIDRFAEPKWDCVHYGGEKPCRYGGRCKACTEYRPQGTRILIIKLGAMGDALRTTPILTALRERYEPCWITWVTDAASYELLEGISLIDRLAILNFDSRLVLEAERFDLLYCFDKTPLATAFAKTLRAARKKGFCLTPYGTLGICDADSRYALQLGLSDPFKFYRNKRSYQDVLFEMAGLSYRGERYAFALGEEARRQGARMLENLGLRGDRPTIGLNTGCGPVFQAKAWPPAAFARLAGRMYREWNANILLLGGRAEVQRNREIEEACRVPVLNTGGDNPVKVFAALVERCDVVVSGDTLAMHLAIALGRPVVALFGCTCPQEIDLYGNGIKLFAGVPCSPCYRHRCDSISCMKAITEDQVFNACRSLLEGRFSVKGERDPIPPGEALHQARRACGGGAGGL